MTEQRALEAAEQVPELVLGRPREFWASRKTAVLMGGINGVSGGAIGAALFIWWLAPADHWVRDSWPLVGAGFLVVWTGFSIALALFLWWVGHGIKRNY